MKSRRLEIHNKLKEVLNSDRVYYRKPNKKDLGLPRIVYKRNDVKTIYANSSPYIFVEEYLVTVIDGPGSSEIADKMLELPRCKFVREFEVENLNHFVFKISI